jgi:glycosyl transferase family 87
VLQRLKPFLIPVLLIVVSGILYHLKIHRQMADFDVYRTAAVRARAAEPLYRAEDGHYQFKYLPAFAIAMIPFAVLDNDTARMIWFFLTIVLLIGYVCWSIRALPSRQQSVHVLTVLTVVLMAKFYGHEVTLGQTNVLFGTLLVAALLALQADRPKVSGALIGAAVFVKPYAVILLPWVAFTYGASAAGVCLCVIAAGLLIPVSIYGWTGNIDLLMAWFRTVTESTAPNLLSNDNISLAAMWAKWIGPTPIASRLAAVSGVATLGLAAAVWFRRRRVSSPDYLEIALLMLLIPLLSPQGWDYVLLLSTPAVICLLDRWPGTSRGWRTFTGVSLALMCFTIFDLMGRVLYSRLMAMSIISVAALCLAVALAHLRWKEIA